MSQETIVIKVDPDLEDLIPGFLENRKKDIEKLKAALQANDFESIRSMGHSLKGVGGGYGFELMSEIGAEIESAAKQSDIEIIRTKITTLEDYMARIEVQYD